MFYETGIDWGATGTWVGAFGTVAAIFGTWSLAFRQERKAEIRRQAELQRFFEDLMVVTADTRKVISTFDVAYADQTWDALAPFVTSAALLKGPYERLREWPARDWPSVFLAVAIDRAGRDLASLEGAAAIIASIAQSQPHMLQIYETPAGRTALEARRSVDHADEVIDRLRAKN